MYQIRLNQKDNTIQLRSVTKNIKLYQTGRRGPAGNDGLIQSVQAGNNIDVDNTDPANPIISSDGGGAVPITTVTANTTLGNNHHTVLVDNASARTIMLPAASGASGRVYVIKNINTGVVTIDGNGEETIDGATTISLPSQWDSATIQCNGSAWFIL